MYDFKYHVSKQRWEDFSKELKLPLLPGFTVVPFN